jgi:outer membrane protein TolC
MTRSLATALLVSLLGLAARSAGAQIVTLDEIEAQAQRERSELIERQAGIERAQAEFAAARSKSAPTLAARTQVGIAPGGRLVRVQDIGGNQYLVQGSQPIGEPGAAVPSARYGALLLGKMTLLDFGRTALGARAAEAAIAAERASLVQAKVELVQGARGAYLAWVEAHQTWQLAERDAEVAAARTVSVKELIAEGARPATDATLSTYDEQIARLRQNRARRAVEEALRALGASVQSPLPAHAVPDLDVLEPAALALAPSASPLPGSPRAAGPGAAPDKAAAVTALEQQQQAALSAARAADRSAAPVLDASLEVGVQGQNENLFPVYQAGVSLTIPIWDGGLHSAQAAIHRAEARGLEARLQVVERALQAAQDAAQSRWQAATAELGLALELLTTAEAMLSEAEDHYQSGSDTLERVLGAQRSLVQARREVLTAKLETARARLDLTPVKVQP